MKKYKNFSNNFHQMERDILLERLEKKLAEKEKEVEELRKMLSSSMLEEIKNEIREEFKKELKTIEAKLAELSKSIDALMNEILFIKSELKSYERKETEIIDIAKEEEKVVEEKEEKEEERKMDFDEEIIVVD
jgi:chromosome segregation ATPase